jgi:leader peptidase (prepilin peptidase)/N-methyltransferase
VIYLIGVFGLIAGLAAHDLAFQALEDDTALRPLTGICPRCRNDRGWLRLRCERCGRPVTREVPVAIGTTVTAIAFANTWGVGWVLLPYLGFLILTASLLVTDIEEFRIVDRLNLRGTLILGAALALAALAGGATVALLRGLLGALAYFTGAFLLWLLVRGRGFGAGDVKLAPQLGLFTAFISWGTLGWGVFSTAMLGGLFSFIMLLLGRAGLKTELPYGPPMILGAWLAIALAGLGVIDVGNP